MASKKQLISRATPAEKKRIEQRAEAAGLSRSDFMIGQSLNGAVVMLDEDADGSEIQALLELQADVRGLLRQVEKAGVNLNQITAKIQAAHAYDIIPAQELRHAADQVEATAAVTAESIAGLVERIDRAQRRQQKRRQRRAVEAGNG